MPQKNSVKLWFTFFLVFLYAFTAFAQSGYTRRIVWSNDLLTNKLSFQHAWYSSEFPDIPLWQERFPVPSANYEAEIINLVFEPVTIASGTAIPSELLVRSGISLERKKPYLTCFILPFRKSPAGTFERLVSFEIRLRQVNNNSEARTAARTYTAHSVLSSGNWYKLGVVSNGVYKVTYEQLRSMGFNMSTLDPQTLRIYGNGGGALPELNSVPRIDDLAENPIEVAGETDGVFNTTDYILFYGRGPDQWKYDAPAKYFKHVNHPYSDTTYYFITSSPQPGPPKRITISPSVTDPATVQVNSFTDYRLHESDALTPVTTNIKSGREWYGEEFDYQLSYDFDFLFPDIDVSTPVTVKTRAIARAKTSSTFSVSFNGSPLYTLSCGAVAMEYDKDYGSLDTETASRTADGPNIRISVTYNKPNSIAKAWLDYVELNARRFLKMSGDMMHFRDDKSIGAGQVAEFNLNGANPNIKIWDVTDPVNVTAQEALYSSGTINFRVLTPVLKEFIAFTGNSYLVPALSGRVANQDLHGVGQPDMVIIAPPGFMAEAERLASFRRQQQGLEILVVPPFQIYNEFSSGTRDVSAIRDFMKMLYDRAGTDPEKMPQYLLLFGDGSYDNKNRIPNNNNWIPTFQSVNSHSPISSYVSDDYYGLLDDVEGGWESGSTVFASVALDLAIGRLPVQDVDQAHKLVNKIIHYSDPATFGDWRNAISLIADDEDGNLHLEDADSQYMYITNKTKRYNFDKIYFDAYQQVATPGGSRYPEVTQAINRRMNSGGLLMNYIGHGGEIGWAHERVLGISDINSWNNYDKMPILFTATCSFSRWDDPMHVSGGEQALLNMKGGAVALVTTTRVVVASGNKALNTAFYQAMLDSSIQAGSRLGDIFVRSKNNGQLIATINTRNFSLLGDPSLPFAVPKLGTVTTMVNGKTVQAGEDTLKALQKVSISGYITDENGQKMSSYNGIVYPTVFDKESTIPTLGQESGSPKTSFKLRKNVIYKGKASVTNGEFTFSFVVPKDISYQVGTGRISYYSSSGNLEASGNYDSVLVGGSSGSTVTDKAGPEISIFLNDEKFVPGGLTGENPLLIVKLKDENGINALGNAIGHDLTATLINESGEELYNLNQFYQAKLDSYQEGEVRFPLYKLKEGKYQLKVKAWDVFNNSGEQTTDFYVASSENFKLDHVLNYPNPFTTHTEFQFEHNRPGDQLEIQIQIFTVTGKLIRSLSASMFAAGSRISGIAWNGRDDFGDKLGRGVYLYRMRVRSSEGSVAEKFEKLVILN